MDLKGKHGYKFAAVVADPPATTRPADPRWPVPKLWVLEESARDMLGAPKDYGIWDKGMVREETETVRRSNDAASEAWRHRVFEDPSSAGYTPRQVSRAGPGGGRASIFCLNISCGLE